MKNYIQEGCVLELTAPSTLVSGAGSMVGAVYAVAEHDVASGERFSGRIEGVVELPKASAAAFVEGEIVYWDDSGKELIESASGAFAIGFATEIKAGGTTLVKVKLHGQAVAAVA